MKSRLSRTDSSLFKGRGFSCTVIDLVMKIQPFQRDEQLILTFPGKKEKDVSFLRVQIHHEL